MIKDTKQETDQGYSQPSIGDSGGAYWLPSNVDKEQRQTVIAVESTGPKLSKQMFESKSTTNEYKAIKCTSYATKLTTEIVRWIKDMDNS